MQKRLYRSETDRMIWGVCGGLAEYFDVDPTFVRIIAVLSIFLGFAGIVAYIILALLIPSASSRATDPGSAVKENIEEMRATAETFGKEVKETFEKPAGKIQGQVSHRRLWFGLIVIAIGIAVMLANLGLLKWLQFRLFWPLILVVIGLLIIFASRRRR